jgi:hypothetical protein
MSLEAVALGRNLALILLVVESALISLPLLFVAFYLIKYLRRLKAFIRPRLRRVRRRTRQVEHVTKLSSSMAVTPFLWASASVEGFKRGIARVARRR